MARCRTPIHQRNFEANPTRDFIIQRVIGWLKREPCYTLEGFFSEKDPENYTLRKLDNRLCDRRKAYRKAYETGDYSEAHAKWKEHYSGILALLEKLSDSALFEIENDLTILIYT